MFDILFTILTTILAADQQQKPGPKPLPFPHPED